MLSRVAHLSKISNIKNLTRIINVSNNHKRGLCWMYNNKNSFTIGLTRETVETYDGIDMIDINKNDYIKYNDQLCFIESSIFVESIKAPFDCKIIDRNEDIMKYINIEPECEENAWIIKIEPVIMNSALTYNIPVALNKFLETYRRSSTHNHIPLHHL